MKSEIYKLDDLGNGISKVNGKVTFVKRALPGEILEIKILKDKKNYQEGVISKIIQRSPKRVESICPFYDYCGGCNFLHIDYSFEKEIKKEKALTSYLQLNNFFETINLSYRNKVTFHVENGEIGFYQEKTNQLIDIDYCYLIKANMNKVLALLKKHSDINFNGKILIRENFNKEIMLVIDGNYKNISIIKNDDLINNLIYNSKVLKGKDYFLEQVLNYKFKVNYQSFFQVNTNGLIEIYKILTYFFKNKKINIALDLYSGTSVLGILLSSFSKKVISVEVNKFATDDALENIKLNNISNLEVINGDVSSCINKFHDVDLVLVDPPRHGLDKKSITYLKKINSSYFIYIACSSDSLKRDIKILEDSYDLLEISVVDMFPRTNNFESIAIFKSKRYDKIS